MIKYHKESEQQKIKHQENKQKSIHYIRQSYDRMPLHLVLSYLMSRLWYQLDSQLLVVQVYIVKTNCYNEVAHLDDEEENHRSILDQQNPSEKKRNRNCIVMNVFILTLSR